MTEEYLLKDVDWDDEAIVDREPESSGDGKHHFGFLRLYPLKVTKSFEAGNYVTIPGVTGGNYDDKDENGLKMFKGWTKGGSQYLFVMVATKQNKDGVDFQIVKQYPSKLGRKGDPHLWADFVLPSLQKLSKPQRDKLTAEGVFAEWDELATGHKVEIDGNEYEIKAWGNFKVHSDKASLDKASDEFFGRFSNGSTGLVYPAAWGNAEEMLNYGVDNIIKERNTRDPGEVAVQVGLLANGIVAKTPDGNEADVVKIVNEIFDREIESYPPPMQPDKPVIDLEEMVEYSKSHEVIY